MSRNPFPKIANLFISNRKISVSFLEKGSFQLQVKIQIIIIQNIFLFKKFHFDGAPERLFLSENSKNYSLLCQNLQDSDVISFDNRNTFFPEFINKISNSNSFSGKKQFLPLNISKIKALVQKKKNEFYFDKFNFFSVPCFC